MSLRVASSRGLLTCFRRAHAQASRAYSTEEVRSVNGITYQGIFNGTKLTEGTMALPDGRKYSGRFGDDGQLLDGGALTFDGGIYRGQFRDWTRHGVGRTEYTTGKVEEGTYVNNTLISGIVVISQDNGHQTVMEGTFKDGQLVKGTLRRPGFVYTGEFRQGVPHGEGESSFDSGVKHIGRYRQGRFYGKGSLITKAGEVFSGDFENGKLLEGTLQYMDGSRYEGQFSESGELHGEGVYEHAATGNTYTGHWDRGQFKSGQVLDKDGYPTELVTGGLRISDLQK